MEKQGKGIVYLAFGYEYLLMAAHSAMTAKETNPGIVCELITNVPFDPESVGDRYRFDKVTFLSLEAEENRYVKTSIVNYTNLEYGVYIDCDTEVRGNLDPAFQCLEHFDLAIKHCSKPTRKDYEVAPGLSSRFFPEWNGGVVFFRNNRHSKQLFKEWCDIFRREGKNRDQPALARAIYHSKWEGRLLSLNAVWNTVRADVRLLQNGMSDSRIWHYRKAEEWPAVAPSILAAHEGFRETVAEKTPSMQADLDEVERRYAFFASPLYRFSCRHPALQRNFMKAVRALMKVNAVNRFKLERDGRVAGESYQRIGSKAVS